MNLNPSQYRLIKPLSWSEVFGYWEKNESQDLTWIEHYKSRGFSSWEEWRSLYTEAFQCEQRIWRLYHVKNPLEIIPYWNGGPFKTWVELYYDGQKSRTFRELAGRKELQENEKIKDLIQNFPQKTTLIGLIKNSEITVIEGMHRCLAIALAAQQKHPLATNISICLADIGKEELPAVGQFKK